MTSRPTSADPQPRREPQQERSRSAVDRVLAAADAEIGEVGLAGASTTSIARRAGVSVGSMYRFFADKQAIADALADRYLAAVVPVYESVLAPATTLAELEERVRELVRRAAEFQSAHPGYYRLTEDLTPEHHDSPGHRVREPLIHLFTQALAGVGLVGEHEGVRRVVELCIETVRHTLAHAPQSTTERQLVVDELETMIVTYVSARFPAQ